MAMVAPTLSHDQASGGADATRGSVHGNRLVQDEICAYFKGLLHSGLAIHQREGDAALIGLSLAQFLQDGRALLYVITVDQESVILMAGQGCARLLWAVAKFKFNVGRIQHAAEGAVDLRVAAEEERLESHSTDVIGITRSRPSNQRNSPATAGVQHLCGR